MSTDLQPEILFRAKFNPKLKSYWLAGTVFGCVCTVIGIPFLIIIIPIMLWRMGELFDAMECYVTERSLVIKRGVWFRSEKTVPLNKIQDLALKHGPLLNYFALSSLTLETAGQSASGGADASLTGIFDAEEFRDRVLRQRDLIEAGLPSSQETVESLASASSLGTSAPDEAIELLREIRDSLKRLEDK